MFDYCGTVYLHGNKRILYQTQLVSKCRLLLGTHLQGHGIPCMYFIICDVLDAKFSFMQTDFFPVLFCIARTAGWLAHWREQVNDPIPIFRPKQVSEETVRQYVPLANRGAAQPGETTKKELLDKQSARKNLGRK
jgi:hypothetical protein